MPTTNELALRKITRTDPEIPPIRIAELPTDGASERGLIVDQLAISCRDAQSVLQAIAVHDAFLAYCDVPSLRDALPEQFIEFVAGASTQQAQHLRRNDLLTCQRILASGGRMDATHVLEDIRPELDPVPARSEPRVGRPADAERTAQTVTATSDEVRLMRSAIDLARGRDKYRPAAAVAISTSAGTPQEAPGVRWTHLQPEQAPCKAIDLSGAHLGDTTNGRYQAPRTNTLDPWESRTLTLWRDEAEPESGSRSSIIYTAFSSLTSETAVKSVVRAVNVVREAAALEHAPGATPGGLAHWSATHTLAYHGIDAAAARLGCTPSVLLHRLGIYP